MLSVAIPLRNGWHALPDTLTSIVRGRAGRGPFEIVVVDDASDEPPPKGELRAFVAGLGDPDAQIVVVRSPTRLGVPRARNMACARATGDVLVVTDAHVRFAPGWDAVIERSIIPDTVLAGSIWDPTSRFVGYGCTLVVPFMGTRWVRERPEPGDPIQIASSAATVMHRSTFERIGGYDAGMRLYGAAEPEFSLRAWLAGVEVLACPDFTVSHRFKTAPERRAFLAVARPFLLHNCMRFGLIYLDDAEALRMLRHLCGEFPRQAPRALTMLADGYVWERRAALRERLAHDFEWFVERFDLPDQTGVPLRAVAA